MGIKLSSNNCFHVPLSHKYTQKPTTPTSVSQIATTKEDKIQNNDTLLHWEDSLERPEKELAEYKTEILNLIGAQVKARLKICNKMIRAC